LDDEDLLYPSDFSVSCGAPFNCCMSRLGF
jgi:hypothetical protein